MDSEQYSLNNLRDIVLPDPPPFWPPAPGMWVLVAMVMSVVLVAFFLWRTSRKRNAYRRAGLALLGGVSTEHDVSVVLKRVALVVFPREQVASLHGKEWVAFLNRTCSRSHFLELATTDLNSEPGQDLIGLAGTWIRHHRIPDFRTPKTEH